MMSKITLRIFICISLAIIIILTIVFISIRQNRESRSFRIYYNNITPLILDEMGQYDMNIVEASFFEKDDVAQIHAAGSKIVGYLSLIEIGYWDTPLVNDLYEGDYLRGALNEKLKSLNEKNYLADLSSPHYREVLFKYIETRILDKGMDGLFFDTVDWIDYYADNKRLYNALTSGYHTFLDELRERYPGITVIQNRGFDSYESFSHEFIDGILFENFKSPYLLQDEKKITALKRFRKSARKQKTEVYAISFENEAENRKLAESFHWNFMYSQMDDRYSQWDIQIR